MELVIGKEHKERERMVSPTERVEREREREKGKGIFEMKVQ